MSNNRSVNFSFCALNNVTTSISSKNVTKKVNYLVIGELASRDWVASSHGRKIEKALVFKEKGVPVMMLSEKDWVGFV